MEITEIFRIIVYQQTKEQNMITNKQILDEGQLIQDYPIDYNPFTGQSESNGGVENLVIYDNKVYSVLTDFTGSIADPNGEPSLVTDDADAFMQAMFLVDDEEEILNAEADAQWDMDIEDWEWREKNVDGLGKDWDRNDDW